MDPELRELLAAADAASERGDHRLGADLSARAAVRAEETGEPLMAADALARLALNQARLGELVAATANGQRALAHCGGPEGADRVSAIHSTLSLAYERAGLHTFAVAHARKALDVARARHDLLGECWALNRLGTAGEDPLDPHSGLDMLAQAVALARQLGHPSALFGALNNLSRRWVVEADRLAHRGEDPQPALRQALPLAEEAAHLPPIGASAFLATTSMANLAGIHRRLGQSAQARQHFAAALDIARHQGYTGLVATVRLALACLDLEEAPSARTRRAVQQLVDGEPMGADPDLVLQARRALVRGYRDGDDIGAALAQMEHLHEALMSAQARRVDLQSRLLLNQAELDQSRHTAMQLGLTRDLLEREVAARTVDLERAKAAAETASRAKSSFLSTVSHELHTPLNGLIGMVGLALRRATEPRQIDLLHKAAASAWQLNALFDNILDFVAADADAPAVPAPTDLRQLLEAVREKRVAAAQAKGMEVDVACDDELPRRLEVDGSRLSRILDALVDNAIKFSTHGPVRLAARGTPDADGALALRVEVTDHGEGVPPETLARLFRPFEMGDDSPTRSHRGLGLGLALAQRLAGSLGGRVGVDVRPGEGSTFWVALPAKAA